jgi:hypothetical protein
MELLTAENWEPMTPVESGWCWDVTWVIEREDRRVEVSEQQMVY